MTKELLKPVIISITIGLIFGLFLSNFIIESNYSSLSPLLTTIILTATTTLFSGISAFYALIVENKLRKINWKNEIVRRIFSYIIILISISIVIYLLATRVQIFNNIEIPGNIGLYIPFLGFSIGFLVIYIDYINYKKEQKILLLEQENKYLSEIAYKDKLFQETVRSLILSEERNRIAKELHDSIAQSIHAINFLAKVLKKEKSFNNSSLEIIENIEKAAQQTINDLRVVIKELTPGKLERLGLLRAIEEMTEISKDIYKIKYDLELNYENQLTPTQEVALYRIIQEAINNIEKHADASIIKISIREKDEKIHLSIVDDGNGFEVDDAYLGNGIKNMQERAIQTGGELSIHSNNDGTTIKGSWKIAKNLSTKR